MLIVDMRVVDTTPVAPLCPLALGVVVPTRL